MNVTLTAACNSFAVDSRCGLRLITVVTDTLPTDILADLDYIYRWLFAFDLPLDVVLWK